MRPRTILFNILYYSFFSLLLTQVLMTGDVNIHHGYKGIMDLLLRKPARYLEACGANFMYYKDTSGQMDSVTVTGAGSNVGLVERYKRTKSGGEIQIETPLFLDLCDLKQYLLSGVDIKIALHPADQKIALMTADTTILYKVLVSDHVLRWQFVEPTSPVLYHHLELLTHSPALYSMPKSSIKSYTIPKGVNDWHLDSVFSILPHTMYVTCLKGDAFTGDLRSNPFNFQHFNLESLSFHIENQQTISLTPDFDRGQYSVEYGETVRQNSDSSIIEYVDFPKGYSIFTLPISSGVRRSHNMASAPASTRLHVRFKKALEQNTSLLVYGLGYQQLRIDRAKNVYIVN